MELVLVFAVNLIEISSINLVGVMEVIGAFRVYTFMDDKVLPLFLWNKCVAAMRAAQFYRREAAFRRGEFRSTDFAEELAFLAIVFVKEWFRGTAEGAGAVVRDIIL